ncbi:unnamed protein product, partial [Oncorhynchus mykiss]
AHTHTHTHTSKMHYREDDLVKRTLFVNGISKYAEEKHIKQHFEQAYENCCVLEARICYDVAKLMSLNSERKKTERSMKFFKDLQSKEHIPTMINPKPCGHLCCCIIKGCEQVRPTSSCISTLTSNPFTVPRRLQYHAVYSTRRLQYHAVYSTTPFTVPRRLQYHAVYSTTPFTVPCRYSTPPFTVPHRLQYHAVFFCVSKCHNQIPIGYVALSDQLFWSFIPSHL